VIGKILQGIDGFGFVPGKTFCRSLVRFIGGSGGEEYDNLTGNLGTFGLIPGISAYFGGIYPNRRLFSGYFWAQVLCF
jgi:hypothetical protein